MGKVDVVTINHRPNYCFNLDRRVGRNGANLVGDVAIIQGYLKYIQPYDKLMSDGEAIPVVPEVNGRFDSTTAEAIETYQKNFSFRLLSSDGAIDPASYKNRNLNDVYNPLMTITFLHIHAKNANKFYPYPNYIVGMMMTIPQVLLLNRRGGLSNLSNLMSSISKIDLDGII